MSHSEHTALAHHFDSLEQQREASTLGMWLFLVQEIMFFGGLFMCYLLYRWKDPEAFAAGSHELSITLGGFNTVVLIGSSLTMALGVRAAQTGKQKALVNWLVATGVLFGVGDGMGRQRVARGQYLQFGVVAMISAGIFTICYLAAYSAGLRRGASPR